MLRDILDKKTVSFEDELKNTEAGKGSIKDNMDDLHDILEEGIKKSSASEEEKESYLKKLETFCNTETNILIVGATGSGKSSTINALFAVGEEKKEVSDDDDCDSEEPILRNPRVEIAKVGSKADPETKDIEKYKIGNLILWDTPGFGDGTEIDEHHKEVVTELLREKDSERRPLIDLVLVILDGSTKDLGTSYKILNDVIIPKLRYDKGRILIALNQADIAMKTGRHWDYEKNEPDEVLVKFLEEKVQSIKARIKEDSGLDIDPIYYCAGYEEEGGDVVKPYNLSKLLMYILKSLPQHKRISIFEGLRFNADNFEYNDDDEYNEEIKEDFYDSIDYTSDGVDKGAEIGETILGFHGMVVGAFIGGFIGCVRDIIEDTF